METSTKTKKIKILTLLLAILVVALFLGIVITSVVYNTSNRSENLFVKAAIGNINFPAAIIEFKGAISINEVQKNTEAVKRFYESQDFSKIEMRVDFSTSDGKKRLKIKEKEVLDKLIEDEIIRLLAVEEGISIAKENVDAVVGQRLEEYGSEEEVKNDLYVKYGWTMEQFKEKVVMPGLYKDELEKLAIERYITSEKSKNIINKAKSEMENGMSFEDVAKEYSQGLTANEGGSIGWITKDQLVPELALEIGKLSDGESSSVIESALGFHIINLKEQKREQGIVLFNIGQVFVRRPSFIDWLDLKKGEMNIFIPMGEFHWDKKNGSVEFEEKEMIRFEEEMMEKAQGDASIMF